jgi:hypothetical protein
MAVSTINILLEQRYLHTHSVFADIKFVFFLQNFDGKG